METSEALVGVLTSVHFKAKFIKKETGIMFHVSHGIPNKLAWLPLWLCATGLKNHV